MKKLILSQSIAFALLLLLFSCSRDSGGDTPAPPPSTGKQIKINTPGGVSGFLYVDGKYIGKSAPATISLSPGKHIVGVASDADWKYYRKEINVVDAATVDLTATDVPTARKWKVLWVGARSVTNGNGCTNQFSQQELDSGYSFFTWSVQEHFKKYSYGTIDWEVSRKDIPEDVSLYNGNIGYTLEPTELIKHINVNPGDYDCIFVFWRQKQGACDLNGNYFGLGWTDPLGLSFKAGYVTVKFDAGSSIDSQIQNYKDNDPGVWVHEWLHTVGEKFYIDRGFTMPKQAGDGFRVHAAEIYGYKFPWMNWYKDFMGGRVRDTSLGYVGIGPEAFLKCPLRDEAANKCVN